MTALLELGRQGKPITGIEVIDMHSHIGRAAFTIPDTTAEGIVEVMARTGVAVTVTTAMLPMSEAEYDAANAKVLEATHAHAGRILGYYRPFPSDPAVSIEEAGDRIDAGFVGLKLHNVNGFPYTHASYAPYLAAANGGEIGMQHLLQATRREHQKVGRAVSEGALAGPNGASDG